MKKLILTLIILSTNLYAAENAFNCNMKNGSATIDGSSNETTTTLTILDKKNELDISDFNSTENLKFNRVTRKREAKYTFAKYYNDDHHTLGLSFSLPKNLDTKKPDSKFTAYLTVYADDGDFMVPSDAVVFNCELQNN